MRNCSATPLKISEFLTQILYISVKASQERTAFARVTSLMDFHHEVFHT